MDESHTWLSGERFHRVAQDGYEILHRQCRDCGRDFALFGSSAWEAVYVGLFKIERLAEAVTSRWTSEKCPKQRLVSDASDRMTRRADAAA